MYLKQSLVTLSSMHLFFKMRLSVTVYNCKAIPYFFLIFPMSKQPSAVLTSAFGGVWSGSNKPSSALYLRSTLWALSHVWSNTETSKTNSSLCWWSYLRVVLNWFFCWPGGSLPPEWAKLWMWRCWGRFLLCQVPCHGLIFLTNSF